MPGITKYGLEFEAGIEKGHRPAEAIAAAFDNVISAALRGRGRKEVAGRVVQQFAYHKLMTELKARQYNVVDESVDQDDSIQVRVRLGR